ncbi:hypothetical protein OROGR_030809 [Orobanche gracilis]
MVSPSVLMMLSTLCIALIIIIVFGIAMAKKNNKNLTVPNPEKKLFDDVVPSTVGIESQKKVKKHHPKKKKKIEKPPVFLDIEIGGISKGRIIIKLFDDQVPSAAENFRNLCKGFNKPGSPGKVLHYKGSKFHLINRGLAAQGGGLTFGDGTSGDYATLSGGRFVKMTDKNIGKHNVPYLVSMANHGQQLVIGSQFFITFSSLPHLDRKHVVFGKVVEGFKVLSQMEEVKTILGKPIADVVIADCGEIVQEKDVVNDSV